MRLATLFLTLLTLSLPFGTPAAAQELTSCTTSIDGEILKLNYLAEMDEVKENQSFRERLWSKRRDLDCPAFVALRYMTPELDDTERGPFCVIWDEERKTYSGFAQGERDAYLVCKEPTRSFCERVNDSADTAALITGLRQPKTPEEEEYLRESSGAVILRGGDTVISRTLSEAVQGAVVSLLGTAVTAVGATAATSALVVVGGAVYACRP